MTLKMTNTQIIQLLADAKTQREIADATSAKLGKHPTQNIRYSQWTPQQRAERFQMEAIIQRANARIGDIMAAIDTETYDRPLMEYVADWRQRYYPQL